MSSNLWVAIGVQCITSFTSALLALCISSIRARLLAVERLGAIRQCLAGGSVDQRRLSGDEQEPHRFRLGRDRDGIVRYWSLGAARLYGVAAGLVYYFARRGSAQSVLGTIVAGMAVYLPLHIGLGW